MLPPIAADVPLGPLTTLELGGRARFLVDAGDESTVIAALRWAAQRGLPAFVLGGGSNLVVPDSGYDGLCIRMTARGLAFTSDGVVSAQAGEPWDPLVAETVRRELAGLECLSGIPGLAGATPIQNVGAYGQEVAETIRSVRVVDRDTLAVVELPPDACGFGYRQSRFKRDPGRFVVLAVTFALRPGGPPTVIYRELQQALAAAAASAGAARPATLAEVRDLVLRLRRNKSMVMDPSDPNRRSVGSFFMNPILPADEAQRLIERLVAGGKAVTAADVPAFPAAGGALKLSAAWLIERAGFARGFRSGAVGISTRHALALVHHGGGTTAELLALAEQIRDSVAHQFGVELTPEPVVLPAARRW
ncbi:MAG TPA: UDP-N-acetylmuramate dehydrogenase [Polyangia bacterium]|jgi:UDP-N-acetylmuramate dehydrogenase|nr:UDP-N-acetylmuramate dehydrogenase [Polyangia bacterium]